MKTDEKSRVMISPAQQKKWGWPAPLLKKGASLVIFSGTEQSVPFWFLVEQNEWRQKFQQALEQKIIEPDIIFQNQRAVQLDSVGRVVLGGEAVKKELTPMSTAPDQLEMRSKLLVRSDGSDKILKITNATLQNVLKILSQTE